MIAILRDKLSSFFSKGHERTLKAKKNIAKSFLLKGLSICISFVLIPITISYINPLQYGVWLTLSSVINWLNFFDVGLGNGLKNKLAETNALEQQSQAKIYVSTTYALLTAIVTVFFLIYLILSHFINWNDVLNIHVINNNELATIALCVVILFCVQFVSQLIFTVLTASHQAAKVSLLGLLGQILNLILIYILIRYSKQSLLYLILVLAGAPIFVQLVANFWYYRLSLKSIAPSFKHIKLKFAKGLLNVGGAFFVIQIGVLILFQTDNIIITQLFGPTEVTTFNIAFKLFNAVLMVFNIIITPFWSAFTDAYAKNDLEWMKQTLFKMKRYCFILAGITILLLFLSPLIYRVWLNGKVEVSFTLSCSMALYVIVYTWETSHVYMLNGIGKIRLQLYLVTLSAIVNIPLGIFLGRYLGLAGVTLANSAVTILLGWAFTVQCKKILANQAVGLWNK